MLVSSENIMGSDKEFTLRGRSFIHMINNKSPRIDPWGTPHLADMWQHFTTTAVMIIVGIGRLALQHVQNTSCYLHSTLH
jgi:hypothetical protein